MQSKKDSNIVISIVKLKHAINLPLPSYATLGSAGMDLIAATDTNGILLKANCGRGLIPTGLRIAIPEGYEAQIRARSGLAIKNGVTVINGVGTIDSDYRGEIFVGLINLSNEDYLVTYGMKIAQLIVAQYNCVHWNIEDELNDTNRGHGGFGSTGI